MSASPRQPWRRFNRWCLGTGAGLLASVYLFVALVDPHDHLALSPPGTRAPINQNQRFSYPALARSGRFDSVILGTSTSRMLRPARFDALLGARFVNLAMNSATAYEQARLMEVFMRHHPAPKDLVLGLDISWCVVNDREERYTFREFPEWLYDRSPWNDYLHLLNGKTLEQAARQVEYWLDLREPRYGLDGYRNFLPAAAEYDPVRARELIYGSGGVRERTVPDPAVNLAPETVSGWRYPGLERLATLLANLPGSTRMALFFVPYHVFYQATPGTLAAAQWDECRRRVVRIAQGRPATVVLDFMIPSPVTTVDSNYWDPLHFTTGVAEQVATSIARAMTDPGHRDASFRGLHTR